MWVWVNSRSWWWTGRPGMLQFMGSLRVGHDWVTELNWIHLQIDDFYDRGWDGWMASPTQWTWVWMNSRSWGWTGRPGVLRFMRSQRVGHDWVTELNWIYLQIDHFYDRGWDRWMASPTQWTWVWMNSGSWVMDREAWQCCGSWGRKKSDRTEWLNWTAMPSVYSYSVNWL